MTHIPSARAKYTTGDGCKSGSAQNDQGQRITWDCGYSILEDFSIPPTVTPSDKTPPCIPPDLNTGGGFLTGIVLIAPGWLWILLQR